MIASIYLRILDLRVLMILIRLFLNWIQNLYIIMEMVKKREFECEMERKRDGGERENNNDLLLEDMSV